ncbi:methyl-accepting chemotaxis protein [Laribacter hongkongensis]|uniref:Chemotaxis protein n=1 Tax=Laribacter hongkongensis TaxID=168471 RepID=A0A248LJ61_9NEIS|nr:methyl-accepting chemotaxis protein [Laribacter hongkongensis]ASJ24203.1 chemotaxis protein [Laribacter hongkongensis]MCG9025751.1 methyl-accepting chemotaxis protein [Laribacter hongkongensis]MCG9031838.1 methyl-accepting chemotaxis protein [Laribacter hongkongensis]MCG9040160.1 methyl-accepting chemotaxis protein [Laribacter hongkongensis]MCG9053007.1 methyl-accepting chemotaxis protein [Laribacter hongkongensis]
MAFSDWFIPERIRQRQDQLIQARTTVNVAMLAALLTPLFSVSYFKLGHSAMGFGILAGGAGMALSVLLMRLTGLMQLAANVAITSMYAMVCWMAWVNGGLMGTSIVWFATVPFAAIFIAGRRAGYVWAVLTLLALVLFMLLHNDPGALPDIPIPATEFPFMQLKSLVGLTLVVLALALAFDSAKAKGFNSLETAREQAESSRHAIAAMLDQIARSVRAASQESKDIADSAHLMVDTMQKQSARTQEMVVTVQQMSDLTSHNADQTVHAAEVAGNARQHASAGGQVMDEAVRRLDEAGQAMSRSAAAIESLERRSNEVSGIAQLIGEIADQTNLLALNAAIEAARAGEMGRGFAVVADEVRKLAERTQSATKDIEAKIGLIVDGTQEALIAIRDGSSRMQSGAGNARAAQESLSGIISNAHELANVLEAVSSAGSTQSQGFKTFAGNVTAIGRATQTLSDETGSIAGSTRRLDALMAELQDFTRRYEAAQSQPA